MTEIHLSDRLGHVTSKKIGFSWWYLFLGPFYCFGRLHILLGILELLFYYYLLPIPGLDKVCKGIVSLANNMVTDLSPSFETNLSNALLVFRIGRGYYWVLSIIFVLLLHIIASFYMQGFFLKREMKKKQLRPVEESDARLLIKYHVTNTDVALAESFDLRQSSSYKSAEESWYENNAKRIRGDRSTRYMTRSTILFAGDKTTYGKKKNQPGTQTIEIEAWNDNSFGGIDVSNENKVEKKDDEFSNFTDYSQFIKKDENTEENVELTTEPVTMEIRSSDIDLGIFASSSKSKNDDEKKDTIDDLLY